MTEPLTSRQRSIFWTLAIFIAVSRVYALSRSLWDWDEALFCNALRQYDVTVHHPHPPGFPLFILTAKAIRLLIHSDFRALQAVTLLGAVFLFPALFAFARELRLPFVAAIGGAAICCFFPTIWFYGGTALSDIPATTLAVAACALLLRGCEDRRAYVAGAIVLAVSVGFRPQNLLIGCASSLYATWCAVRARAWRSIAAAIGIAFAIVAGSYLGAAYLSANPPRGYWGAVVNHQTYLRTVDSFLNPHRQPLRQLAVDFFIHPISSGRFDWVIVGLAAIGLAVHLRRFGTVMLVLTFAPFAIFAWLMLDTNSVSRFATAYVPLYAILAALGACAIPWPSVAAVLVAIVAARLASWTLPAIREVREAESPSVAAMRAIARTPASLPLFVDGSMRPFADYYLPKRPFTVAEEERDLPITGVSGTAPFVAEGIEASSETREFIRKRGRLWQIVRHRYFETSITPIREVWRFGDGWYGAEGEGTVLYRWMGSKSRTILPPVGPRARLEIAIAIPSELVKEAPTLTVELNGNVVARVRCTAEYSKMSWDVAARPDAANELVLSIDRVVNPLRQHISGDPRDLGLELRSYSWTAVR